MSLAPIILGIETSCDETAVAAVTSDGKILGQQLRSQWDAHKIYGGVVPELAARAHLEILPVLTARLLADLHIDGAVIAALGVTTGPGLVGGLLVGSSFAQMLGLVWQKPVYAINHLEAHALTPHYTENLDFPYLLLLVSGGHSQFLWVRGLRDYRLLGGTLDDAVGEAFDKVGKLLGLGFPGGPAVERAAQNGNADRFELPTPLWGRAGCDLSLSGLKTAVRHAAMALPQPLTAGDAADLSAAFQMAVGRMLGNRLEQAMAMVQTELPPDRPPAVAIAGGVAANQYLRHILAIGAERAGWRFYAPPQNLCGDNAVMVAWAALSRWRRGLPPSAQIQTRPRWPLGELVD
jgi:N6-L-threonylcarbamoyladenine synthase